MTSVRGMLDSSTFPGGAMFNILPMSRTTFLTLCVLLISGGLPTMGAAEDWKTLDEYFDALDRRCTTAADCEVKNVGNCCGTLPRCVNKNATPDLEAVKTLCAKQDVVSVCGFQPIAHCICVSDRCEAPESAAAIQEIQ